MVQGFGRAGFGRVSELQTGGRGRWASARRAGLEPAGLERMEAIGGSRADGSRPVASAGGCRYRCCCHRFRYSHTSAPAPSRLPSYSTPPHPVTPRPAPPHSTWPCRAVPCPHLPCPFVHPPS